MDPSLLLLEQERTRLIKEIRVIQKHHKDALTQLSLAEDGYSIVEAEVRRRQEAADAQHDAKITFLMRAIDKQYAECDTLRSKLNDSVGELSRRQNARVQFRDAVGEAANVLLDMLAQLSNAITQIQEGSKEDAATIEATDAKLHKDLFDLQHTTSFLQRRSRQLQESMNDQQAKEDAILSSTKEKLAALDEAKSHQLECFTHSVYFLSSQASPGSGSVYSSSRQSPAPHIPGGNRLSAVDVEEEEEELPRDPRKDPRLRPTPFAPSSSSVSLPASQQQQCSARDAGESNDQQQKRVTSRSPNLFLRAPRIRWPHKSTIDNNATSKTVMSTAETGAAGSLR